MNNYAFKPRLARECSSPLLELSPKKILKLEILDALALYLDRNGEEDTIAVAFDKTSAVVRCILAKQITPIAEDRRYAKKFFSAISTPQSQRDLIYFALEYTSTNIRKKIQDF